MDLEVIKYLETHTYEDLENDFSIICGDYEDYAILNYTLKSPKFHPIVRECRSLILHKATREVFARGFDRFFEYKEDPSVNYSNISMNITTCQEKLDGSLILVWWNPIIREWTCSTKTKVFAEGPVYGWESEGMTFKDLIMESLGNKNLNDVFSKEDKNKTYIFELISPKWKLITPYNKTELKLLCIRDKHTGKEEINIKELTDTAIRLNVSTPKEYTFKKLEDVFSELSNLKDTDEGFVLTTILDGEVIRIKIKTDSFKKLFRIRNNGNFTDSLLIQAVWYENELYRNKKYFPEIEERIKQIEIAKTKFINHLNKLMEKYNHIEEQKEYALAIEHSPLKSFLFKLRSGVKLSEIMENTSEKLAVNMIELFLNMKDSVE